MNASERVFLQLFFFDRFLNPSEYRLVSILVRLPGLLPGPSFFLFCNYFSSVSFWTHQSMGLPASWDDFLGYCLAPLLAYEDSSVQAAADLEELREPLLRSVPPRYSLSSFVVHLNHCDSQKIFQQCLAQRAAVIGCRGDDVTFAIRARVLMFPENACSSRVMLAVRYRSTDGNVSTEWHRWRDGAAWSSIWRQRSPTRGVLWVERNLWRIWAYNVHVRWYS